MMTRRQFLEGSGAVLIGHSLLGHAAAALTTPDFAQIEAATGGRLGVAILDTATGVKTGYRPNERFAMCSTFKVLAVAAILSRVDKRQDRLDRRIHYSAADILSYAPITKHHADSNGLSLEELCAAAITVSDNTAANLLLAQYGGPAGLTSYIRGLNDSVTRLDHTEPAVSQATPGDLHDTTTPDAMVENLRTLILGNALSPASRTLLTTWLEGCKTGDKRLRAGLPKDWRIGDKTGSGYNGTTNDIGVIWPPQRPPLVVAVYLTGATVPAAAREAAIATVGQLIYQSGIKSN